MAVRLSQAIQKPGHHCLLGIRCCLNGERKGNYLSILVSMYIYLSNDWNTSCNKPGSYCRKSKLSSLGKTVHIGMCKLASLTSNAPTNYTVPVNYSWCSHLQFSMKPSLQVFCVVTVHSLWFWHSKKSDYNKTGACKYNCENNVIALYSSSDKVVE